MWSGGVRSTEFRLGGIDSRQPQTPEPPAVCGAAGAKHPPPPPPPRADRAQPQPPPHPHPTPTPHTLPTTPMKSQATTVAAYLDSLPPDRREAIQTVRRVILDTLAHNTPGAKGAKGIGAGAGDCEERMQYGAIAFCVPHSVWPHGHHVHPELPLMYMGLSSQKNDMVVYMMCMHQNKPVRDWFDNAWKATGKKLNISTVGGCCLRFKKLEDLSLDLIAEVIRRVPVQKYLEHHTRELEKTGRGPDGKPLEKSGGKAAGAKASKAPPKKKTPGKKTTGKKTTTKKTAAKRG